MYEVNLNNNGDAKLSPVSCLLDRALFPLHQVLELPALSCQHFSNVPVFVLFAGILWVGASNSHRFLGILKNVSVMPIFTGSLSSASSGFHGIS
jgi:hypothetical protein